MYKPNQTRIIHISYNDDRKSEPYRASFSFPLVDEPFALAYCGYGKTPERAMLNLVITLIVNSWNDDWWFIRQINELLDRLIEIKRWRKSEEGTRWLEEKENK